MPKFIDKRVDRSFRLVYKHVENNVDFKKYGDMKISLEHKHMPVVLHNYNIDSEGNAHHILGDNNA